MWTICSIIVINEDDKSLKKIINGIYKNIVDFENEFSRFRIDSQLSKLNRDKKMPVSDIFLLMLDRSREMFSLTDWYFNPLIDLRKIWYSDSFEIWRFEKINLVEDLNFNDIKNYWNLLEIWQDMNLDFWAIAKWFLADILSGALKSAWYNDHMINLWGDICLSWYNLFWGKWQVGISSPFDKNEIFTTLELSSKSISTSWTFIRKWKINNEDYHHIRNPLSDKSENELISVSVINRYWYKSDSLATALIAMWKSKALEFCEDNDIDYLFIMKNREILSNLR
ncbi:MAG: Membrane-associated lipoprotein [uncultured bacterium (gcode 4)]|uniref:FAD:protein FMN transferase n=1 Tax=uncultured bacterium (gcode 4) TaxID=1234023 RepID=K2GD87_9BACT|nr:MAG: Membrane-associated lipoprotein [uncultured bacterium (gcode 4)]